MKKVIGLLWIWILFPALLPAQNAFDILGGKSRVVINFEYANNFILLHVRLFGILPLSFIYDTGAEHTILFKKEFADIFGTKYDLRVPILGTDQSREVYALVARSVDMELEGLDPVQRDILVLEEDYLTLDQITGRPIQGILGSSFFRNVIVQIDFRKQRIILHRPDTFVPPGRPFRAFDISVRAGKPYLETSVTLAGDTTVPVTLLIDTGAGLPLLLHNNTDPRLKLPPQYILGKLGLGLGGYVMGHLGRIESLNLDGLHFPGILTSFQDLSDAILEDSTRFRNGLIGTQLLMRFQVYLDYINEKMYLRTVGHYNKKFKSDKSGLVILAMGQNLNTFFVQDILPNSPAAEAGIRPGDVIRKVQGLPANVRSLGGLLKIFQKKEGRVIRIVVQRKQQLLRKRIVLRELI